MKKYIILALFAAALIVPSGVFAQATSIILKSNFLKNDQTAQSIASGNTTQYDIRILPTTAPFYTNNFGYRFVSALRMLGYTASFMQGNTAEVFLNNFEKANGLAQSPFITKSILATVDGKLAQTEVRDSSLANDFPLYKYYINAPTNEPPKEHAAAVFSIAFKNLPSSLVTQNEQGFLDYLGFQQPGRITSQIMSDVFTVCDPTMYQETRDVCKIDPAINYVYGYSNDFDDATLLLHEYAHYLDGNIFQKASGVSRGIIDTAGFYGISYNVPDIKVASNGWKFYTYKNPSNIKNEFVSSYAQGWSMSDGSVYYTAYEDFAESFAMYVTQGKAFRLLATTNSVLKQKYDWLKLNVFKGIEYSTGVDNALSVVKSNPNHAPNLTVSTGIFNIEEYSLGIPGFVWDYNFASFGAIVNPVATQSKVSIVGAPTLALTYNSAHGESQLTETANVKVTAGPVSMKIYSSMLGFPIIDSKGSEDRLNSPTFSVTNSSNLSKGVDMYGRSYFVLPANVATTFKVVRVANPQQMFAGSYYAALRFMYYEDPTQAGNTVNFIIPVNKSNTVTIVGEKSPYITSIASPSDTGTKVTVTGVRFNAKDSIVIDGVVSSARGDLIINSTSMVFTPNFFNITAGSHSIGIFDPTTGNSNNVQLQLKGGSLAQPTVSVVGTPTLKLSYDANKKESSLVGKATVQISSGGGEVDIPTSGPYLTVANAMVNGGGDISLDYQSITSAPTTHLATGRYTSGLAFYIIPANTTVQFQITRTMNPQQMFAGQYYAYVASLNVATGNNNIGSLSVPSNKSSTVTIVGEKSPYLTAILSSGQFPTQTISQGSTMTVSGARLTLPVSILIDSQTYRVDETGGVSSISFTLPSSIGIGSHSLQVSNSKGASNILRFTVVSASTPIALPVISFVYPTSGEIGSSVTIYGTGFRSTDDVNWRETGVTPTYVAVDGTKMTFIVPAYANFGVQNIDINRIGISGSNYVPFTVTTKSSVLITSSNKTTSLRPTISGTARGLSQLGVVLSNPGGKVYSSGLIPVINGNWSIAVSPALSIGGYTLDIYDANNNSLERDGFSIVAPTTPVPTPVAPTTLVPTPVVPPPPTGASSSCNPDASFTVKWTQPSGYTHNYLEITTDSIHGTYSIILDGTSPYTFTAASYPPGTAYYWRVMTRDPSLADASHPQGYGSTPVGSSLICTLPTPLPTQTYRCGGTLLSTKAPCPGTITSSPSPLGAWSAAGPGGTEYCKTDSTNVCKYYAISTSLSASAFNAFGQNGGVAPVATVAATVNPSSTQNPNSCVALANDVQYRDNDTLNGGAISQLQSFLQSQNYLSSAPTGYFGDQTFVAVRAFQVANGIKDSGYVGALTRSKIQEVSCQ